MSDYNKQTVANLRQLLKDRGIPSTGLTRKAQIIEKLEEFDSKASGNSAASEEATEESTPAAVRLEETPADEGDADAERPHVLVTPQVDPEPVAQDEAAPIDAPTATPGIANTQASADTADAEPSKNDLSHDAPEAPPVPIEPDTTAEEPEPTPVVAETAMVDRTPSPSPDEQAAVEKPEISLARKQSAAETTELEAESRKRKRRSPSPSLSLQDVQAKKSRPNNDAAPEVHLKEDQDFDTVMDESQPEDTEKHVEATKKDKDPRFRELFKSEPEIVSKEPATDDRHKVPALHPATPALYIRNFMRPLREKALHDHLLSLASEPNTKNDSVIIELFMDNMKTHAFVQFSSTTFASRVRSSLHGTIWPPEANRKELWVDFVPVSKVEDWIQQEQAAIAAEKASRVAGRPIAAKKFEVVYSSANGSVEAIFQEVGAVGPTWNPPTGPRRGSQQIGAPRKDNGAAPRKDIGKSFDALQQLYPLTTTKPQLYYLPVPDDVSRERLRDLDRETSRDWAPEERRRGRGMQRSRLDEKVRFGFDDANRVIEVGKDFGPWAENSGRGGFRGGRRGGRGFGRGGGWRSGP